MFTKTKKWLIAALAALAIIALSVCGALNFTSASADDEIDWDSVEATEVDEASDLSTLVSGTKYKLTADIALESSLTIAAGTSIYLDLNGYTLSLATGYATTRVIYIAGSNSTTGGDFTLDDTSAAGTGKVTGGYSEVTDFTTSHTGGGVYVGTGAIFTMNGGTICGNYAYYGGGVYTVETGSFIMNGGTISENAAVQGGGVNVGLVMAMNGGEIINNTATDDHIGSTVTCVGGGIYLGSVCSALYLYGGSISGNTVEAGEDACGGGIYSLYASIIAHGSPVVTGNTVGSTTNNIEFKYSGLSVILDGDLNSAASLGITANDEGLVAKTEGYTVSGTISSDTTTAFNTSSRGYYYGSATGDVQSSSNVASITIGSTTYYYNSLATAIASNIADEYTVNIIKSVDIDGTIVFPEYSTVTLNTSVTNGVTITYPDAVTDASNWFYVLKNSNVVILGDITFEGNDEDHSGTAFSKYLFENYGSLTLGEVDSTANPTVQNFYSSGYGAIYTGYVHVYDETTYKVVIYENVDDRDGTGNNKKYRGGTLTINGGLYTNNKAENGGVIYAGFGVYVYINGGSFTSNEATTNGGVIYTANSVRLVSISDGEFTNNKATAGSGGAVCIVSNSSWQSAIEVTGGEFTNNTATSETTSNGSGGAIYVSGQVRERTINISNATFAYNYATNSGAAVYVYRSTTLTITNCTFNDNGYYVNDEQETVVTSSGGAINLGSTDSDSTRSTIIINSGEFTNNKAKNGGVVYGEAGSCLEIYGGTFEGNAATSHGGVIYMSCYNVSISGGEFINNTAATNGGAVYLSFRREGVITISGGYFGTTAENEEAASPVDTYKNTATSGGAVYLTGTGTTNISNTVFAYNEATNGGAIYVYTGNTVLNIKSGSEFYKNKATTDGGAIWANTNITVNIDDGKFDNNSAVLGGALRIRGSSTGVTSTISGGTFTNNSASTNGGAVYCMGNIQKIIGGTFTNNSASTNGGAVYASSGTSLIITGGDFESNSATNGGAIYLLSYSSTNGTNITISGGTIGGSEEDRNIASSLGGGIYICNGVAVTLSGNPVISYNTANSSDSNLYFANADKITFEDSLTSDASIGITMKTVGQFTTTETDTKYYIYSAQYIHSDDTTYNVVANSSGYLSLSTAAIHTISYYEDTADETPEVQINVLVSETTYTVDFTLFTKSGSYVSSYNTSKEGDGDTYNRTSNTITLTSGGSTNLWVVSGSWTESSYTVTPATLTFSGTYGYDSIAGQTLTVKNGDENATGYSVSSYESAYVSVSDNEDGTITVAPVTELSAGTYETTITVKTSDTATFEIAVTITIAKAALTNVTETNYTGTYDGDSHTGSVSAETVDGSSVTYAYSTTNNGTYDLTEMPTYTDAGTYTVYYQITAENHETKTGSVTISIAKADISSATVKVSGSYVYTGAEQTVKYSVSLSGFSSSALTYTVSGNTGTNVGSYTLTLTGSGNFTGTVTKSWTISKVTYDLSGLTMNDSTITYDGLSHTIEIVGTLPTGASATYTSYTNVGTYTVTATISGNSNYEDATMTATLTISNASLTIETTNYSGAYDGSAHTGSVAATTVDKTTATIMYGTTKGTYDLTTIPSYTDAGTYKIYYQVTAANHTTKTGYITVEITSVVTADSSNTVKGEITSDSFALNTISYVMNEVSADDYADAVERAIVNVVAHIDGVDNAEVVAIYDITLTSNGETITVSEATNGGTITIKVALPEALSDTDTFYIVHIHDGSFKTIISSNSYTVEDGYVTFSTNTLSQFVFVVPTEATADSGSTDSGSSSGGSTEGGSTSGGSSSGSTDSGSSSVDTGTTDIGTDDGNGTLLTVVLVTGGVVIVLAAVIIVAVVLKKRKS